MFSVGVHDDLFPQVLVKQVHDVFLFNLLLLLQVPLVLEIPPYLRHQILSQFVVLHPLAHIQHVLPEPYRQLVVFRHFPPDFIQRERVQPRHDDHRRHAVDAFRRVQGGNVTVTDGHDCRESPVQRRYVLLEHVRIVQTLLFGPGDVVLVEGGSADQPEETGQNVRDEQDDEQQLHERQQHVHVVVVVQFLILLLQLTDLQHP